MSNAYHVKQILDRLHENWLKELPAETEIVFAIIRLHNLIRQKTDKLLRQHELTASAFEVLSALHSVPEPRQMTPSELSRSVLISSGGMTKVLIGMESRGLIERMENPSDGRSSLVRLTSAGKQKVESVMIQVLELDRSHFAEIFTSGKIRSIREVVLEMVDKVECAN